ncbi:MAG: FliM/FliN family flagellar motor switch protein [Ignavibacteriae bacterium]|nr:FliM/FliN family flagellar motor switch protein [Ignavibacteriota bacterium]
MKQQIAHTHLQIIAELGKSSITVEELLKLKVGDVIRTTTHIDQEIEVSIDGKRKLAARPGTSDGKKAIRIIRQLTEDDLVEQDILYKPGNH